MLNMNTQVFFSLEMKNGTVINLTSRKSGYFLLLFLDVLLCHDDELEGRRVAFILYLAPQWDSSDGGTLDLYTTDSKYFTNCVFSVCNKVNA